MMPQKVLIIEDSAAFSGLLKSQFLTKYGYESDIAESFAQAKALLDSNANQYFAAIVDVNLPDAPSGEATDLVVPFNIPAIVYTASTSQSLKEDLWERGIADYALKTTSYSLEYISWAVDRLYKNVNVSVLVVDDSIVARKSLAKLIKLQRFNVFSSVR